MTDYSIELSISHGAILCKLIHEIVVRDFKENVWHLCFWYIKYRNNTYVRYTREIYI